MSPHQHQATHSTSTHHNSKLPPGHTHTHPAHTQIMGRSHKSLVQKLLRAADSPYFEVPRSWHVLSRYRTAELFLKHPSPPAVRYNDTRLYKDLLQRYPEVKLQPLRVNSSQPSLATRFVDQQQQAMQELRQTHQQEQQQQQEQQLQLQQRGLLQGQDLQQPQRLSTYKLRDVAFRQVEAKMARELQEAGRETTAGGYLEYIQEQEEEALQAALKKLKEQEAALKP